MAYFRNLFAKVRRGVEGATAVEYGLMVVLIAAVIVGVVYAIGQQTEAGFSDVCNELGRVTTEGTAGCADGDAT